MSKFLRFSSKLTLSFFALFTLFSCSKDADLLSEYVINENDDLQSLTILTNDSFYMAAGQNTILMDVLNNDNLSDNVNVTIIETSAPLNGIVTINDDNTLTYRAGETTPEETTPEETTTEETTTEETTTEETTTEETTTEETTTEETTTEETTTEETTTEETTTEDDNTPEEQSTTEDTFTYTAEVVDEETGTVTVEEAIVNITVSTSENIVPTTGENVYYITAAGKSSNNGKSEQSAWDIEHGFKTAKAGDIIHIKAGNYGSKNLIVQNSGTTNSPIQFIGYSNNPGDIISIEGSTFNYGDSLDPTKMPLIKSSTNGESGIGIHIWKNYIQIENFQIQLYERGIDANGESQIFKNIITYETGPQNINTPSGQGVVIRGSNTRLENSFDYNSVSQGITLNDASNVEVIYCKVYNDNEINPGGYYILMSGGTTNSTVENCIIYKKPGLFHGGHGYVMKDVATNNTFRKSVAYNTGIEANFSDVHDNLWEDIEIYGVWPESDQSDHSASIKLSNGAHHNNFKNIHLKNVKRAFTFLDWDDGLVGNGGDLQQGSSDNQFDNIKVENASRLIYFGEGESSNTFSSNNTWNNCEFKNIELGFALLTKNSNNIMKSCSFDNIEIWEMSSLEFNFSFENCTLLNSQFTVEGLN